MLTNQREKKNTQRRRIVDENSEDKKHDQRTPIANATDAAVSLTAEYDDTPSRPLTFPMPAVGGETLALSHR